MNILIGGAWPYTNGSLHIGHLAALLPGDVLARYHRQKGDTVYYVSGSDCYGTPVAIRAKQEETSPEQISMHYHEEFKNCFQKLGFTYDEYGYTSSHEHIKFVQDFHRTLYESKYIEERDTKEPYCPSCDTILVDRMVTGICPHCHENARGEQCDACGEVLDANQLLEPTCATCKSRAIFIDQRNLYLKISKLKDELTKFLEAHPHWRKNAISFTKRYIDEGLRDRAITRHLDWGIPVPKDAYEDKRIYIWAENVLGYLSMSKLNCQEQGTSFDVLWDKSTNNRHYYVHGKDNIPFHTIILPSLLLANGSNLRLPDDIISSEHLMLEGKKISTSQNHAIYLPDLIDVLQADQIRYYLLAHGPEKKDANFTWPAFVLANNGELLGAYGNYVNRTLAFIRKYFDGDIPYSSLEEQSFATLTYLYQSVGEQIESGAFKNACNSIFSFIRQANLTFDQEQPWITRTTDKNACFKTLSNCVHTIANLATLMAPFTPFSSEKILSWLGLDDSWVVKEVDLELHIPETKILFNRLDINEVSKSFS